METSAGICPVCGSVNLNYETCVNNAERVYYPYICEDCGTSGKEWYNLTFCEHTD